MHDRCRCDPCTDANRDGQAEIRRLNTVEAWFPDRAPWVDGDLVRAHLAGLRAEGMGRKWIADQAGVSDSTLSGIVHGSHPGQPDHPRHRPPRHRVSRQVADRIFALEVPKVAGGTRVGAVGTIRRLRALIAAGWSRLRLASMLGITNDSLGRILNGHTGGCRQSTVDKVAAIYDEAWQGPPPPRNRWEASAITRSKVAARAAGWAPALAWDDSTIDDPAARPHGVAGHQRNRDA